MSGPSPAQEWWSAAELAASGLPDVPGTKRKVNEMARREGWGRLKNKVRRRRGAGGGVEYHWSVLPLRARLKMGMAVAKTPTTPRGNDDAWARFDAAGDTARAEAERRLNGITQVEALEGAGLTRSMAVREVARKLERSDATVWNWLRMIEGVAAPDRLAYLVDGRAVRAAPAAQRSGHGAVLQ